MSLGAGPFVLLLLSEAGWSRFPWGAVHSGAPFSVSSGGRDLFHRLIPDVVVVFPVRDISGLHAQAAGDLPDLGDAAPPPGGDDVPQGVAGLGAADLAGELGHVVSACLDQRADLRPVRLAGRD